MKRLLNLCLAALAGLAAASCNFEDVYTISNMDDIVTVKGEYLVSDYGTTYHITEDKTTSKDWKKDDTRLYAVFDVLNRQLDISLKEVRPLQIVEAAPLTVLEEDPKDPVVVALQNVSGGYINLALQIYMKKATECPHDISFQYRKAPDGNEVEVYVFHEGNNENPTLLAEDDLEKEIRFYSIPLESIQASDNEVLILNLDVLVQDTDGKYYVKRTSYQLVRSSSRY